MATPSTKAKRKPQPAVSAPDRDERLYQELARKLIAAIKSGTYQVGGRLPAEREGAV